MVRFGPCSAVQPRFRSQVPTDGSWYAPLHRESRRDCVLAESPGVARGREVGRGWCTVTNRFPEMEAKAAKGRVGCGMRGFRVAPVWLLFAVAGAACQHAPCPRATIQVQIDAAEAGGPFRLERVDGGAQSLPVTPGRHRYAIGPGAWRICGQGGQRWPVPAFADVVGSDGLRLWVGPSNGGADPEFALIPGGPTLVGDRLGVGQPDERPPRIVEVPPFEMARFEVTNREFVAFLNAGHRRSSSNPTVLDLIDIENAKCRVQRLDTGAFATDAPALPAVTVSWAGARAYCAWRTERTGRVHRLPTEIEWEKAARGPESAVFSYGDVYTPDAANQESGRLREVGEFPSNGFGLFDMTGNAFEWTADAVRNHQGKIQRVYLRGGSFVLDGIFLRNAFRMWLRPTVRADDVGFRVVREIDDGE